MRFPSSSALVVLFGLLISVAIAQQTDYQKLTAALANYDTCHVAGGAVKVAILWTIAGQSITFSVTGKTEGFVGFGRSTNTGPGSMSLSDVAIGTTTSVDDYWMTAQAPCSGANGVCTDVSRGGADSLTATSFVRTEGFATMTFTRPLAADDAVFDLPIAAGVQNFLWALGPAGEAIAYHQARDFFTLDLFQTPACPVGCSGHGTCTKGCCTCDAGWDEFDCSRNVSAVAPPSNLDPIVDPEAYPFSQELNDKFKVYWLVDEEAEEIEIAVVATATGWVAFGPSKTSSMVDSDVVFGWVDDSQVPFANDVYIDARSGGCPGVCPDSNAAIGGTDNIIDFNGRQVDGVTEMKWRRKLDTGDTNGDIVISKGSIGVIWGYGTLDGPGVTQHEFAAKGVAQIDFFTGDGNVVSKDTERTVHGIMMFVAWALIIPGAGLLARYLKKFPWWFNVHRLMNSFAMLVVLVSFIVAVFMTTAHFDSFHKILGLIIVIIGLAQPVIGTVADKWWSPERNGTPVFPDKIHWVLGWGSFFLALVNIAVGLNINDTRTALFATYLAYAGLLLIGIIILFIVLFVKGAGGH